MPSFQIGEAPTQVTLQAPSGGGQPTGSISFPVRNLTAKPQTGRIRIEPLGGAKAEWFSLEGAPTTSPAELDRDFDASGNQVAVVKVTPPAGAPAGSYTFQLKVIAEHDPDTDVATGPAVGFSVAAAPVAPPVKAKFPWWAVAVAAVLVIAVGGGVGYFALRKTEDPNAVLLPVMANKDHVAIAQQLATGGLSATFALTSQGDAANMSIADSNPKENTKVSPDTVVALTVKRSASGPCPSVVCSFTNAVFTPEAMSLLATQAFDRKFAPALEVVDGKVVIDEARFNAIANPPPPQPALVRVPLPRVGGVDIKDATTILLDLGLTVEAVSVGDGAEDGKVRRSIPTGPTEVDKGTTVVLLYRSKPKISCNTIFCRLGAVKIQPEMAEMLKRQDFKAEAINPAVLDRQRLILQPDMFRFR